MSGNPKIAAAGAIDTVAALSYGLLVLHMDDWGRRRADVRELKLNVFQALPHVDTPDIERILSILADERVRLLVLYEVGGRQYIQCDPESFYESQTYIKTAAKQRDSSKCPPPQGHPWADYWPDSDWRKPTGNSAELHSVQKSALGAESNGELQPVQKSAPSVFHFSSPLFTSPPNPDDDNAPDDDEPKPPKPEDPNKVPALAYINGYNANWALSGDPWMQLLEFGDSLGWPLVVEAVKRAATAGVRDLKYVLRILRNWQEEKLLTVEAVLAADVARQNEQKRKQALPGRGAPRGQPDKRSSNVFFTSGKEKDKDYYAHIYRKFGDDPPDPNGGDPPPDDGRESA
jgi:DnaD/phage-associated family protein